MEDYLENLKKKYNSSTISNTDNIFLIEKYRTAVGARNVPKLSDIELNKKSIIKKNTNFQEKSIPRAAATSVNDSYFNMSNSLMPKMAFQGNT